MAQFCSNELNLDTGNALVNTVGLAIKLLMKELATSREFSDHEWSCLLLGLAQGVGSSFAILLEQEGFEPTIQPFAEHLLAIARSEAGFSASQRSLN